MQDEKLIRVAQEKDKILKLLRQKGMRVTKQRRLILDIVFEHECTSCKEIYYQAAKKDKNIGIATVYRMVNVLEDQGVFQAGASYRPQGNICRVVLRDQSVVELKPEEWHEALKEALIRRGYARDVGIDKVIL